MLDHAVNEPLGIAILIVAGLVAGTLNVIAGGGSFLTLPVLIFLGLPPGVANGTNRVGILLQNVAAVSTFRRAGVLDSKLGLSAALPACFGAILGTRLAIATEDRTFQQVLAILMVVVTLASLWRPAPADTNGQNSVGRARMVAMGFFVVGVYGGFVQAGVGFLILATTTLAGLDLVRGNAVKVLAVLCFTSISLALFVIEGRVAWIPGLSLAVGTTIGGILGARLTVLKGHTWIQKVVTAAILVFAVRLWLTS